MVESTNGRESNLLSHVLQLGSQVLFQNVSFAAEGKGFEPSSLDENCVSSAARQTVSGYLPSIGPRNHQTSWL